MKPFSFFLNLLGHHLGFLNSFSDFDNKKMDIFLDALINNKESMGSLSIVWNNVVLYEKVIGYSFINDDEATVATSKTKYKIASITKTFTATIILQLIQEDKLDFETKLDVFFPEIPNSNSITICHLLYHCSGLANFLRNNSWKLGFQTKQEILHMIYNSKPHFEPGSTVSYSNTNYLLLGYIVETICQKSFDLVLQEWICNKIGLENTVYGWNIEKDNEYQSYFLMNDNWQPYPGVDSSLAGAAGAIVSTSTDVAKFMDALFTGKLIDKVYVEKLKEIRDGFGIGIKKINAPNGYMSTGHIDGFNNIACYFPNEHLSVVYCSNSCGYSFADVIKGIISICFNARYTVPDFKNRASLRSKDLDRHVGLYFSQKVNLKIEISKSEMGLVAQATGQSSFHLLQVGMNAFSFDKADIDITFLKDGERMIFAQKGITIIFSKEKA